MPLPAEASRGWEYVSGRCAAREALIMDREFFDDLLKSGTGEEAYGQVSKSEYVELFPHPETLRDYDRFLSEHFEKAVLDIGGECPGEGPAEIFILGNELVNVHELLMRREEARTSAEETARWAERLGTGFPWLSGFALSEHGRGIFERRSMRAFSLWVDSAYIAEMLRLGSLCPGVENYARAYAALSMVEVCWRSLESGVDPDMLGEFFLRSPLPVLAAGALEGLKGKSPAAILRIFGPEDFSVPEEEFDNSFGRASDDYLTSVAGEGRHVVCGAARVLHYLRQLWVEHFNMRLCLAAVLTPLDLAGSRMRLRHG